MGTRHTVINALIGAVVGVVLSVLPFSTLLGGLVSGFLEGPEETDGALAGALAGLIMFVPIGLIALAVFAFLGLGVGVGGVPVGGFFFFLVFLGFAVATMLVYTAGLGALGGYLGAYLAREYPERHASTAETIGTRPAEPRRDEKRERTGTDEAEPTRWQEELEDQPEGPDEERR